MLTPQGVAPHVAGKHRVKVADLRRKLGDSTWWVYQVLLARRDVHGVTRITNAGISRAKGFAPQPIRTVRKGIAKLIKAGLVEVVGWTERVVPHGKSAPRAAFVYLRKVFGSGSQGELASSAWFFVPAKAVAWLATASGHGGRRVGSGRKSSRNEEGMPHLKTKSLGSKEIVESRGADLESRGADPPVFKRGHRRTLSKSIDQIPVISSLRSEIGAPTSGRASPSVSESREETGTLATLSLDPVRHGLFLGGSSEGIPIRPKTLGTVTSPLRGTPPAPWFTLPRVATPNPPLLSADMTALERVGYLVKAYRGAIQARYAQDCWVFKRGPLQKSKWYKTLVASAEEFIRLSIAPAAWVAWCIDLWRHNNPPATPPPIPVIFSATRIAQRRGWFNREKISYMGGRVIVGPLRRELLTKWLAMRTAILREDAWEDPGPVVDRFFPDGSYDMLVSRARREAERTQAELTTAVDAGEFIW